MTRAVILDRDGVIVHPVDGYLSDPRAIEWIPGSLSVIAMLQQHGIHVSLATNQAGVASGALTFDDVRRVNTRIEAELLKLGGRGFYSVRVCGHAKDANCGCRKPKPGLLLMCAADMSLDPAACCYVGDHIDDWRAAINADMLPVLVRTGRGAAAENEILGAYPAPFVRTLTFDSLWDARDFLCDWGVR